MNKNKTRRNFIKKNLILLFSFSIFKINFSIPYFKTQKLRKRKNFIWYLNEND